MAQRYDVVILGAGNAGMAAARVVREHGRSVAIVENREVGGTCPLRGCVPKKVLVAAAEAMEQIANASQHCIEAGRPRLDWSRLIDRERSFVEGQV
jgi:glutathione reductase (NADPH)